MSIIRLQGGVEKSRGIYYQLDSNDQPIGVGGMGQVFKGVCVNERTGSTRPVAIKFMFDDLPEHAIERARREASIQLRNDNLVEMLGFIEIAERTPIGDIKMHYHVVSELLTGVSLSDLMDGKTTDRDGVSVAFAEKLLADYKNDSEHFARTIVMNVLAGLMALHDAGYIHRDIDPSNIMVTNDGHIKLIDFGIAKQMNTLTTNDKGLTVAGKFMGKPEYAAPELVLGDISHQNQTTDIYAMGILLYQCITGHTPFEGPRHEILEQQLKTKLPLGPIKNRSFRKIIAKACEKKQIARYQSISQMRAALEMAGSSSASISIPPMVWKAAAAVVVAVLLVGTGVYFLSQNSEPDPGPVAGSGGGQMVALNAEAPSSDAQNAETPPSEVKTTDTPSSDAKAKEENEPPVPPKETPKTETPAKETPKVETPAKETPKVETPAKEKTTTTTTSTKRERSASKSSKGTVTYNTSKTIRCCNGSSITVQAGDRIENAEFDENGYLYQGKWIKSNGETKTILP